jgi:hypothetical protein
MASNFFIISAPFHYCKQAWGQPVTAEAALAGLSELPANRTGAISFVFMIGLLSSPD